MLSYITIGANDLPASGRFYTAVLVPLGYAKTETPEGIEFAASDGSATVYVKQPFDGKPATVGM